ncbi:MAG: reverse transcriptase/maturase family protein [Treponema sp.]|nr:reverse transcriptase/maturase family protein [Treponema sp.]MCL2272983.1 reverse transcriptase/maturase family protein [Treponema sp.]
MKVQPPSFEIIYGMENLYHAWHKVSIGKSSKSSIMNFYRNLDGNLNLISNDLKNKSYYPGSYNRFLIKDPKERIICASHVRDRIVQHAIMNFYEPVFDRHFIYDNYSCRIGKGTHKAVLKAFHFAKNSFYFLKMDVRKYFDSIDHVILKNLLIEIIKDKDVLSLFYMIINSYETTHQKGIPIGNLTSQYFANYYLSAFDHYFKEQRKVKRYIRYMDDFIVFSDNKNELKDIYAFSVFYLEKMLKIFLKPQILNTVKKGAPFLGFLVKHSGIYMQKKIKKRYRDHIKEIEYKRKNEMYSDIDAARRIESITSHLLIARSRNFRNNVLHGRVFGV